MTATDIYFTHSRGFGNAKLKNLGAELQKKFHFNAGKAAEQLPRSCEQMTGTAVLESARRMPWYPCDPV